MIKLIATDMDGTLLNEKSQLPENFFEVLSLLRDKGIHFLAASGRSYVTLRENFLPHADWVDYICDNGACLVAGEEIVQRRLMAPADVQKIVQICAGLPGVRLVLCGVHGSYHAASEPDYHSEIAKYYVNQQIIEDFARIDDDIYKIALLDLHGPAEHALPALQAAFGDRLTMLVSGSIWMDIMDTGVDKGTGLRFFQQKWGITPAETMAFGDYFNDVAMFQYADYSFAMENGHPDIRPMARYLAASNREGGVIQAIQEFALNGEGLTR